MRINAVGSIFKNNSVKFAKKSIANPVKYSNNNGLSNAYYPLINFTRNIKEHNSWGVRVQNGTQDTTVKLFTYPDAQSVNLIVQSNSDIEKNSRYPLENKGEGIFETQVPKSELNHGDLYRFEITKADGKTETVKDPYSFKQPTLLGASEVYDHSKYQWSDRDWFDSNNKNRISRLADNKNGLTPIDSALIYEINIATLTPDGNLESAKSELPKIKEMGFNSIEIMPVENTFSYNWGYDGVDKFAPSQYLGGPDKLKEFIDTAHNNGLNVIMDMVPNHLGPDGAQLQKTGPYMSGSTAWGEAFNYEGENSKYVRDYMVNAALNWVQNYHCDGLRLDMTKHMDSDITMQQIAAEMNAHFPDAFLIAEDGRSNMSVRGDDFWHDWWQPHDERVVNPLSAKESGSGVYFSEHNKKINDIEEGRVPLARLGFDSEWDFHFYHTITKLAYGEADLDGLERAIVDSGSRVKYSTSHDETGNLDGTRLVAKYMVPMLKLSEHVYLQQDDIKRANEYVDLKKNSGENVTFESALGVVKSQKVQQISMKLAQMVQTGRIDKYINANPKYFKEAVLDSLGIDEKSYITPLSVVNAFESSVRTYRAIEALKYFTPGPLMTFQGEDRLEMVKFNFFREFASIKDERYLYIQKGYPNGRSAYEQSKLGNISYSQEGKERMSQFQKLIMDLNEYKISNPASTVGEIVISDTVKHPQNPTIALHAIDKASKNETFVVSNFSNKDYPIYDIEFPKGVWREVINTNESVYGGDDSCLNPQEVLGYGNKKVKSKISLPARSTLIFVRSDKN